MPTERDLALLEDPSREVPKEIDLELALAVLPEVERRLRRLMEIRGVAQHLILAHLKEREGAQRVYGNTVFGLKDGAWSMAEWEARALLKFLTTYVGDDFTQEQLDKAIRIETVAIKAVCEMHGEYEMVVVCRECGVSAERLVVDHRGINAIEKKARKEVKDAIAKHRRRAEPTLTIEQRAPAT